MEAVVCESDNYHSRNFKEVKSINGNIISSFREEMMLGFIGFPDTINIKFSIENKKSLEPIKYFEDSYSYGIRNCVSYNGVDVKPFKIVRKQGGFIGGYEFATFKLVALQDFILILERGKVQIIKKGHIFNNCGIDDSKSFSINWNEYGK
jgi:hypothetical protein